jgi:hypothetical protein
MIETVEAESRSVGTLARLAQAGDRAAFDELQRTCEAKGISYTSGWSAQVVLFRLMDRASPTKLLARASVQESLEATARELADPKDSPIERLIVQRAAHCLIDARMADLEHLQAMEHYDDPRDAEAFDRRRDQAHRRLLATLRALADVRRINRPVVQVNVGDGNLNVLKA